MSERAKTYGESMPLKLRLLPRVNSLTITDPGWRYWLSRELGFAYDRLGQHGKAITELEVALAKYAKIPEKSHHRENLRGLEDIKETLQRLR